MKKVIVVFFDRDVKVFNEDKQTWETCSFHESGILEDTYERQEIANHLMERMDIKENELGWDYKYPFTVKELDKHLLWNPNDDLKPGSEPEFGKGDNFTIDDGIITHVVGNLGYATWSV